MDQTVSMKVTRASLLPTAPGGPVALRVNPGSSLQPTGRAWAQRRLGAQPAFLPASAPGLCRGVMASPSLGLGARRGAVLVP